jgi:hypothetical protein
MDGHVGFSWSPRVWLGDSVFMKWAIFRCFLLLQKSSSSSLYGARSSSNPLLKSKLVCAGRSLIDTHLCQLECLGKEIGQAFAVNIATECLSSTLSSSVDCWQSASQLPRSLALENERTVANSHRLLLYHQNSLHPSCTYISPLKPSGNCKYQLLKKPVTLHFIFVSCDSHCKQRLFP